MRFQWDAAKARSNLEKHHVDFADAVGVFEDEWAVTLETAKIGLSPWGAISQVVYWSSSIHTVKTTSV